MKQEKLDPPNSLINFSRLRLCVKQASATEENIPLSHKEKILCAQILILEKSNYEEAKGKEIGSIVGFILDTRNMDRFDGLAHLLDLDREFVLKYPTFLSRLTQYLLGETKESEHKLINWNFLAKHYPDLFGVEGGSFDHS